jgi:hypothetical protein
MIKTTTSSMLSMLFYLFLGYSLSAQISGISPYSGNRGQTLPIIIAGNQGNFTAQGSGTVFMLSQGSFTMMGSTTQGTMTGVFKNVMIKNVDSEIHADLTIPFNAPLGNYNAYTVANNTAYYLPNAFNVKQGTVTGLSMKTGGGQPGQTVNEEFQWPSEDFTGLNVLDMWLSLNGNTIQTLSNWQVVQKKSGINVDIDIPATAEMGYWKVNMLMTNGDLYVSPSVFHITADFKVNDFIIEDLNLYPNPTSDYLILEFKEVADRQYRILDLSGRIILLDESKGVNEHEIDVNGLKPGQYILHVIQDDRVTSAKKWLKH